ncbi:MAG: imidazole glycerol phosphate synthase subunit HisF [Candidatus Micrarchaeia archaeon]
MLAKRIIPCLDCDLSVKEGRVVKGVEFKQIRYAGVPWELAERYYEEGADEIVFLDITASHERRETMVEVVKKTSEKVFVPITVGGGIKSVEDARRIFEVGGDKVSVNTSAIKRPSLITEIAEHFGSQACVVAIDCKRRRAEEKEEKNTNLVREFGAYVETAGERHPIKTPEGEFWFECSVYGGRTFTGVDAIAWAKKAQELGAGEILLTSMDRDGTNKGYDIELTRAVAESVTIPVIASGGAGTVEHIRLALTEGKADAALLAGQLHFGRLKIGEIKEYLAKNGVVVRC